MRNQQDSVIVVGGGLAGLACATYLARGGRAVTVLEKAHALGGRAVTDRDHGFSLNRGAHALYTGGPASEVLRELGVTFASGISSLSFARDAAGVHLFPATPVQLLRTTLLDGADKREMLGLFLRLGTLSADRLGSQSTADFLNNAIRRPRVRQVMETVARVFAYSSALDLASADFVVGKVQQTMRHPVRYISGGWQVLVDGLRDAALDAGANIRTTAGVDGVSLVGGQAVGVRLHGGEALDAGEVVLALPPEDALRLLPLAAESHLARFVRASVPVHVACLDVALSRLPSSRYPVVFDMDKPRFLTLQSLVADVAPSGGAVVHAFTQPDPRQPTDPEHDRAMLEELLDQFQPGWRDVVVEQRFLPRMLGSGTLPLASQGGLAGRPDVRSRDVPNVLFAGDWVGPRGYLADATLHSARSAAQAVLARSGRAMLQEQAA